MKEIDAFVHQNWKVNLVNTTWKDTENVDVEEMRDF